MTQRPRDISLCWGTCEGAPFDELVAAAAATGYSSVALTPAMFFAELAKGRSPSDLRAVLAHHDIAVSMLDPLIRGLPNVPSPDDVGKRWRSTFEHGEEDCFAAAQDLRAPAVNIAHYLGQPTALDDLGRAVGQIADRAAAAGLNLFVEFMPEGAIADLADAVAVVQYADRANVGVLFDTWHFYRTGGTLAQVEALPDHTVHGAQVSDAPAALFATGLHPSSPDRLVPGAGAIPLRPILDTLQAKHADLVLALEVFDRATRDEPAVDRARRAMTSFCDEILPFLRPERA